MSNTCLVRQLQYIQYVGKPGKLGKIPGISCGCIAYMRSPVGVLRRRTGKRNVAPLSELMAVLYTKFDVYRRRIVAGAGPRRMLALWPTLGSSHLVLT